MIKNQAIKDLSGVKSRDQNKILLIKVLDPGRGWIYRYCESDYPLHGGVLAYSAPLYIRHLTSGYVKSPLYPHVISRGIH